MNDFFSFLFLPRFAFLADCHPRVTKEMPLIVFSVYPRLPSLGLGLFASTDSSLLLFRSIVLEKGPLDTHHGASFLGPRTVDAV